MNAVAHWQDLKFLGEVIKL